MKIEIGDKEYNVRLVESKEDKLKGLQGVSKLEDDEGMLFIYDEPKTVGFWMKDTLIPLDIIFIDQDGEVISIYQGEPGNLDIAKEDNVKYVLEVNVNSGIEEGDELELDSDDSNLKVIAPDGSIQYELENGARILSRKNTVALIKMAKKADASKDDKHFRALGKKMFKFLDIQDSNEPEYVDSPENKKD